MARQNTKAIHTKLTKYGDKLMKKTVTVSFENKEYCFPYYRDLDSKEVDFLNIPKITKLIKTKSRNGNAFTRRQPVMDKTVIENIIRLGTEKVHLLTRYLKDEISLEEYKQYLDGAN